MGNNSSNTRGSSNSSSSGGGGRDQGAGAVQTPQQSSQASSSPLPKAGPLVRITNRETGVGEGRQQQPSYAWPSSYYWPTPSDKKARDELWSSRLPRSLGVAFSKESLFWFKNVPEARQFLFDGVQQLEPAYKEFESFSKAVDQEKNSGEKLLPSTLLKTTDPRMLGFAEISKQFKEKGAPGSSFVETPLILVIWQLVIERLPVEQLAVVSQVCRAFYVLSTPKVNSYQDPS